MLKSELDISQEIKLLDIQLNSYCISVLNPTFINASKASGDNYEFLFRRLNKLIKGDLAQFRNIFIKHLMKEKAILTVINIVLTKDAIKELNIDTGLLNNTKQQITAVSKIIEDCCINSTINPSMIFQYFFNSLQLLTYFTAIRSSIATIQNICNKFNKNENSCVLKFIHTKKTSFAISQQRELIEFVEKVLKGLFDEHLDIITTDFDTGSPELEIIINIAAELDINTLLSELFELIFKAKFVDSARALLVIYAMLFKYRKGDTKQLSDNDIDNRLLKINNEYNKLLGKFHTEPKRNNKNKIEIEISSIEEQTASNNDKNRGDSKCIAVNRNHNQNEPIDEKKLDLMTDSAKVADAQGHARVTDSYD